MGCVCLEYDIQEEEDQVNLPAINESLQELGMPKFNPPIPKNHAKLVVQYTKKCEGVQPKKNSLVVLCFTGFVLEDGVWRKQHGDSHSSRRLTTPYIECKTIEADEAHEADTSLPVSRMGRMITQTLPEGEEKTKSVGISERDSDVSSTASLVHLKTTLYGQCYDYSESWEIQLGAGEVVQGMEEVILKMSVGDEVVAFIPSNLAYGEKGLNNMIPPNANLVVQILLKSIRKS